MLTVNATGGADDEGIYADKLTISGGNITAAGGDAGINADEIHIAGGNVKVTEGGMFARVTDEYGDSYVPGVIELENVSIIDPEGGMIGDFVYGEVSGDTYRAVLTADGEFADAFIIACGHVSCETVVENNAAPDCENSGSYDNVTYCTVCGDETSRETITVDALGHTEEAVPGKDASCTETGLTDGVKCSVCDKILTAQTVIPALGHTDGDVVVENNVEPDCENSGSYDNVTYCTVCGDETSRETITVDALGHTDGDVVVENNAAPDCENSGSYDNVTYCTVCGEETSRETITVPALGHKDENKDFVCDACEAKLCTEHTETTVPGKEATCTETGLTDGAKCSVCGETLIKQQVIPAKGHSEEIIPGKDATCTETGLTDGMKCSVCGKVLSEQAEIPAKGHGEEILPGKEPTCTEGGLSSGVKCPVCDEILTEQEELPAAGHTPEEDDGDCTTAVKCSVCGGEAIPASEDHIYGKDHHCTACGKEVLVYVAFHSLSLKGDSGVNYYLHIDESIVQDETGFMRFITPRGGTVDIPISQADVRTAGGETYYGFTATVAAKEMTDVVSGQYFYTGGSSAVKNYSVKEYADIILENESQSAAFAKAQPMVSAMLDYGAYAQEHFGYNTQKPACDPADVSHVNAQTLSAYKRSGDQGTAKIPFGGSSLILKTETTLRLFFLPEDSAGDMTAVCAGKKLNVNNAKGYSYVNIANISAKDLDADCTVTISDGAETADVIYNPMAYCYNVLNAAEGTYAPALLNTVRALYLYNQAANDYFN